MAFVRALCLVAVTGCYSPSVTTGAPCDERRVCPRDQVCVNGRCERAGTLPPLDATIDDAPIEAAVAPDAALDAPPTGAWSTPTVVGILVGDSKDDASFTPDRLTVVYARNDELYIATRAAIGGAWTVEHLADLSSTSDDRSPEITADGRTIYFTSNRDGDDDVYVSTLLGGVWTTPLQVPGWNTADNEHDVAISPDELTAFIGVSGDLRRATRQAKTDMWGAPVALGVAWGTGPAAPSINADGDVYFHAGSVRDLYVARRSGTSYGAPAAITELNSGDRDSAPFIAPDDRHIMFTRAGELFESSR